MTTLIHTWPRDVISISQESVARAKADFQQVDKQSLPESAHQPFNDAFFFLGKATLFCLRGTLEAAEVLHYRGADDRGGFAAPYFSTHLQTGVRILQLLGVDPVQQSCYDLWSQGGELVIRGLEPTEVRDQRLTEEIDLIVHYSTDPHLRLLFSWGAKLTDAYVPSAMDGSEAAQTKALLLSYQRAVDASVADANIRTDRHHRIRSDYNAWRVARSELYKAIENLDWQPLQEEIQVYDTRFDEWDVEQLKWNVNLVVAAFQRSE